MKIVSKRGRIISTAIIAIIAVIWIIPIIFVFTNLFKGRVEYNLGSFWAIPEGNMFMSNLREATKGIPLVRSMINTVLYSLLGSGLAVIIGTLAAYGLSHLNIRHKMFWFLVIYCGNIFPFQLYLIPVYKAYFETGLYDTRIGITLFYMAICIPFVMFVMRNNFIQIDKEICESARIEGAGDMRILTDILVPMTGAGLSVVFMTQFTWCWNDLMFSLSLIKSSAKQTVMPLISMLDKANAPVLFMVCIAASLPTVILYFLLQRNTDHGLIYTSK